MSGKISALARGGIRDAILKHRFADEFKELLAERAAFACKVYDDAFSEDMRRNMASLPVGWLPEEGSISAQFGPTFDRIELNGSFYFSAPAKLLLDERPEEVRRRFPSRYARNAVKAYDGSDPLCIEYEALRAKVKDFTDRFDAAKGQIDVALKSASTFNRLKKMWPEVTPFCEKFEDKSAAALPALPALPTDQLNAMLNLPVEEIA